MSAIWHRLVQCDRNLLCVESFYLKSCCFTFNHDCRVSEEREAMGGGGNIKVHSQKEKGKVTLSKVWTVTGLWLCAWTLLFKGSSDALWHPARLMLICWNEQKNREIEPCCILHWAWHVSLKWQQWIIITANGRTHACIMDGRMARYVILLSSSPRWQPFLLLLFFLSRHFMKENCRQVGGRRTSTVPAACLRLYGLAHLCCLSPFQFCSCQPAVMGPL